jgi:hypothetical protein
VGRRSEQYERHHEEQCPDRPDKPQRIHDSLDPGAIPAAYCELVPVMLMVMGVCEAGHADRVRGEPYCVCILSHYSAVRDPAPASATGSRAGP